VKPVAPVKPPKSPELKPRWPGIVCANRSRHKAAIEFPFSMPKLRPLAIRPEVAALAVAAYIVAIFNVAFWTGLVGAIYPVGLHDGLLLGAVAIILWLATGLFLGLFAAPYIFKPVAIIVLLLSAGAAYAMAEFGVVFDMGMIANILQTDPAEAGDLMTGKYLRHMLVWAGLPILAVLAIKLTPRRAWDEVRFKAVSGVAIAAIMLALAFPFAGDLMSVFRSQKSLQHQLIPFSVLAGLKSYVATRLAASRTGTLATFGADAMPGPGWSARPAKTITVLVVGETARAHNFALNGYDRQTNPQLSKLTDLINFPDVASCGTATAQSLPCMFSGLGRQGSTLASSWNQEGLLDILQRSGFSMFWRDNQSGCKGVCDRIPNDNIMPVNAKKFYESVASFDEKLLDSLQGWIDGVTGRGVIVLHMMGSHGPAYFKRYPKAFEVFEPACHETQFTHCDRDHIVNAYDNSIVYTDHVLARIIEILRRNDAHGVNTAMMYLSDHGESLGEHGLYLHGLPYVIAPIEQRRVPWLMWLSPTFQRAFAVSTDCLLRRPAGALSHDNFFHTVLGLLDVTTTVYDKALDVTAACTTR
jgi:lipid A ethanolaminephosphotransferase